MSDESFSSGVDQLFTEDEYPEQYADEAAETFVGVSIIKERYDELVDNTTNVKEGQEALNEATYDGDNLLQNEEQIEQHRKEGACVSIEEEVVDDNLLDIFDPAEYEDSLDEDKTLENLPQECLPQPSVALNQKDEDIFDPTDFEMLDMNAPDLGFSPNNEPGQCISIAEFPTLFASSKPPHEPSDIEQHEKAVASFKPVFEVEEICDIPEDRSVTRICNAVLFRNSDGEVDMAQVLRKLHKQEIEESFCTANAKLCGSLQYYVLVYVTESEAINAYTILLETFPQFDLLVCEEREIDEPESIFSIEKAVQVRNIPPEMTRMEIMQMLEINGSICGVKRRDELVYVLYEQSADADAAIQEFNGREMENGSCIFVEKAGNLCFALMMASPKPLPDLEQKALVEPMSEEDSITIEIGAEPPASPQTEQESIELDAPQEHNELQNEIKECIISFDEEVETKAAVAKSARAERQKSPAVYKAEVPTEENCGSKEDYKQKPGCVKQKQEIQQKQSKTSKVKHTLTMPNDESEASKDIVIEYSASQQNEIVVAPLAVLAVEPKVKQCRIDMATYKLLCEEMDVFMNANEDNAERFSKLLLVTEAMK